MKPMAVKQDIDSEDIAIEMVAYMLRFVGFRDFN